MTSMAKKRGLPFPAFGGDEQLANAAGCVAVVESLQQKLPVSNNALVFVAWKKHN